MFAHCSLNVSLREKKKAENILIIAVYAPEEKVCDPGRGQNKV